MSCPPFRFAVITIALTMMWLGPCLRQVFDVHAVRVRTWRMFSSKNLDVCHVRFFQRHRDGRDSAIDRFAVLGIDRREAPEPLRKIYGDERLDRAAEALCAALGEGADLRVDRRCADRDLGWRRAEAREENLCAR